MNGNGASHAPYSPAPGDPAVTATERTLVMMLGAAAEDASAHEHAMVLHAETCAALHHQIERDRESVEACKRDLRGALEAVNASLVAVDRLLGTISGVVEVARVEADAAAEAVLHGREARERLHAEVRAAEERLRAQSDAPTALTTEAIQRIALRRAADAARRAAG